MANGGTANDLDAMHQLLHIKLKWKLTERELEHIERVFAMFDVPAVGSIDRRAFPYAMKRLRFADKSKRSKHGGSWASKRVVREVLNGTYPPFASANSELSYLAYVDAVGRAKDEIVHGDDQALNVAPSGGDGPSAGALAQFGFSGFGIPGFEEEAPAPPPVDISEYGSFGDETDVWSKSVESLGKGALGQAATLFTQALNSGTTKVHGDQRITRRDLSPVLQAVRPGLSEADVSQLCDLAGVTGRHGVTFVDVVLMCGYMELAATTLGGLPQVVRNHAAHAKARAAAVVAAQNAAAVAQRNPPRPPAGLLGSLGSFAVQGGAATFAAASNAASTVPVQGAASSLDSAATNFFGGAFSQASQAVDSAGVGLGASNAGLTPSTSSAADATSSSYLQSSSDMMFSVEEALAKAQTMAGQVAAGATTTGNSSSRSGGGSGAYENKRVAAKRARLEKEQAAAAAAAAEAARGEGPAAMARAAAAAAMDPLYQKQTIGNWFKAKAGTGQVTWRANLHLVFNHVDTDHDGLINLEAFNRLVDDLELDLSEDESWARFCEVDVDNSGEISFDEFERFFETLIMEWRATEDDPSMKIQDQYRPLITLYEPDLGVFGNNADGKRKGFLLLMQRNGFVFWSDKDLNEARAAGHWSSRLGYDDAREAFELAAAYQAGGAQLPGSSSGSSIGARLSRLATLRFVRAMAPEGLALSDADFERLVWAPHVRGYGGNPSAVESGGSSSSSAAAVDSENLEMDLASFRRFVNDSALPRFFQQTLRNQREAAASKSKKKKKQATGANSSGGGGFFGSIFGGSNDNADGGAGSEEAGEDEWREAFTAVDLDGSGDLDIEEVTLLLHGELNMDLTEDEIHALFMKHDTHLTEALDADAFVKLVRDANALVAQTKEARDAEFLGWGRFGAGEDDKATVAARNQRAAAKKKAQDELAARGGRERSRKLKHEEQNHHPDNSAGGVGVGGGGSKLKGDGRHLRRMPSRSQYSFKKADSFNEDGGDENLEGGGNVNAEALAQLKREVSHKLKHDDYAALTPTDIKDLQHNKGRKLEGLDAPDLERIPDPTPAGITQLDQEGYQTEDDDEEEDDDESDFENFNADNMLAREQSRKLAGDASEAAANALEATKLNLVGGRGSSKKAYADIAADLDPDLMAELKTIFQQCLKDADAHGLDQDGFVAAMQQLRLDLPEWKIRETFEEFDADDSGDLDFEEFVELAAMKLVEKWTAKGGKAFLQDNEGGAGNNQSAQANQLKTNARRALSVGEIMNEVMDNKKNEAYQRAKARFHVEEILLIEEAFVSFADPRSRRGRCKITQLGPLCLCMGMNPRDRDVAVLAAEMDPLDTRVFQLPALVEALAKYQNIWRKVDGQLSDFRADQEVLDDAVAMACGRIFRKTLRPAKTAASGSGVPLMEAKLLPAAFRLLGLVLQADMASLWVMEMIMGHDEAQEAADAEDAVALWEDEAHAALEARRSRAPAGSNPEDYQLDEEPPEIVAQRAVIRAASKARRWICLGDLLNIAGRYLHDTVEVVKEVTKTNTVAGVAMTTTEYVTEVVPRARTNAQEEALPLAEDRSRQRAASYLLPYDTVQMAAALFEAMDKESAGKVAAYQLKLMFRRLSWRIGVKPSANQIDSLAASVGYPTGSTQTLSLYDWLFMVEWLGSHKKENNFLGQFGRAIAGFGYIDEGHFEDEEEHWEKVPEFGYTDTMASMRVQGVEAATGKEKMKVRTPRAPSARKESFRMSRESNAFGGSTSGGSFRQSVERDNLNEGWDDDQGGQQQQEEGKNAGGGGGDGDDADAQYTQKVEAVYTLKNLVSEAADWTPEEEQRARNLVAEVQPSREVERLISRGAAMSPSEQNQVQDLLQEMADHLEEQRPTTTGSEGANGNLADRDLSKAAGIVSGIYADTKVKQGAKKAAAQFAKDEAENAWKAQAHGANDGGGAQEETKGGGKEDDDEAARQRQEQDEEPSADSMAQALARAEEARQLRAAETASDREAASLFASHADDDGFLRGQPVLVACLQKCGLNPSKDLRYALLVDGFVQALLALPQNSRLQGNNSNGNAMVDGAENKVLVTRDQFLRLLEQARRFSPRQKRVTRNDLEPEELFLLSDPLGHGFVTMKRVRRIVSAMGLSGRRDARVAEQLVRLGQECAEDHYVVTYDRFIVFIERVRGELQGLGVAAVLDVDLSNEARKAQKAVRQTRASIHETARHEMEKSGKALSAEARALLAGGGRAAAKAAKAAADAQVSAESGAVSDKDYLQSLQSLLDATEGWESKPPAERERTLHLLRLHALEVEKRRKVSSGAVLALEHRIDHLHDRAMRQTAYAKEFAISKLQADAAGVPPTPRAPPRPKEPPLTARVMNTLAAKEQAAADAQARAVAQDKAAAEFRAMNGVPAEPTAPVPSASVFDKKGYLKELNGRAEQARKEFDAMAKVWLADAEEQASGNTHGPARAELEQAAKRAIRLYVQVGGLEPIPSAPTLQIGLIHKRLGNLHDAVECFDNVIDVDPTARCADTASAWDWKGQLLLQLGNKPQDAAYCYSQAVALRPTDPIFKKHLRDAEAGFTTVDSQASSSSGDKKKKKKDKKKNKAQDGTIL